MAQVIMIASGKGGTGKSTVAKLLADKMNFTYVNTGSLYRAVAWALKQADLNIEDISQQFLDNLHLEYKDGVWMVKAFNIVYPL